jgi:hypothetical protein
MSKKDVKNLREIIGFVDKRIDRLQRTIETGIECDIVESKAID